MVKSKDDAKRRYASEPLAKAAAMDLLSPFFDFVEEVSAVSHSGERFRLDAISICRHSGWFLGWEFKKSHFFKSEFADTIRQAIYYRLARIADTRLPVLSGMRVPAVVVFPDWLGEHDDIISNFSREAEGMRLVGAQFRVGTLRQGNYNRLSIVMGQSGIWHSEGGWTKTAKSVLFGKRSLGSTRKTDGTALLSANAKSRLA